MRLRPLGLVFLSLVGCDPMGPSRSGVETHPECSTHHDCELARTTSIAPCTRDICAEGRCIEQPFDGPQPDPVTGDCAKPICRQGKVVVVADSSDLPLRSECRTKPSCTPSDALDLPDGTPCSVGVCHAGLCSEPFGTEDRTTGLPCSSDDDCDKSANGIAHCTALLFAAGPLNPTPICIQVDYGDVCDVGTTLCDGARGLCTKSATHPAMCEAMCVLRADGSWELPCVGKNACNLQRVDTDATGKARLLGSCGGGCNADADCPAGSLCDPTTRLCTKTCTADTDCKPLLTGSASSRCDVARGACAFAYTKKLGDTCTTTDECICSIATGATAGTCVTKCRPGDDCGAGFTCDALVPATSFTFATQPIELLGSCLRNCSSDADCPADTNQICALSAGLTQKTCRPK